MFGVGVNVASRYRWIALLFAGAALSGCAAAPVQMYEGPPAPPDQQSILRVKDLEGVRDRFEIAVVDGKRTISFWRVVTNRYGTSTVYLRPGKHTVRVRHAAWNGYAWGEVWFVAEAGSTYSVNVERRAYRVRFWIEDERTGQPVGGLPGSVDEPPN